MSLGADTRASASGGETPREPGPRTMLVLRLLGASALLGVGAMHLQQYLGPDDFRDIHTIGWLFLLNAAAATVVAIALLIRASVAVALAGIAISAGAVVALIISLNGPLFGFIDVVRAAVVVAFVIEGVAIAALTGFVVALRKRTREAAGAGEP